MSARWVASAAAVAGVAVIGATDVRSQAPRPSDKPTLYVTATAHLDSQWNWTVQDTIRQFVPSTFYTNFQNFERYPDYTFSYEGAIHYMWFKEYHPADWPTLQKYVASGRWRLAGSWINAVDTNVPSPESLMRQALYGKRFFRQEFGKVSDDVYLPDCFGFGFALPSIARHSGMSTFTTQKLTWGSSVPIPFPIGWWKGVDGSEVFAQLNPGSYSTQVRSDISSDPEWTKDFTRLGDGSQVGYRLFGTGDVGGAPDDQSIARVTRAMSANAGAVSVRLTAPEQLAHDLTPAQTAALPVYEGELTMQTHGVGCYTSQAAMKLFNRTNERLADAAERSSVAATWLAALPYPGDRLREAWTRVLWHQFHDDLTGTCIPQAYQFSWNDELISMNQFTSVLTSATTAVSSLLDTQTTGVPLVVYNPLAAARRDAVEATVEFPGGAPSAIRVADLVTGRDVPAQVLTTQGSTARILFLADIPSVAYKVFDVRPASSAMHAAAGSLSVTPSSLENARYSVRIDANGDIASVVDREAGRELLAAPVRLEMRDDPSPDKPAWRILYSTVTAPVREFVATPHIHVVENGPVRVALEISRVAAGSTIVQRVSLTQGGDRVDVQNEIDWKSPNTLLKAAFPFAASNPNATYDLGLGTIQRPNNQPAAYEVPAQQWADITDVSGGMGVAVLNDSKYGWDKPANHILRLTLLHTALPRATPYQGSNDLGHHRFAYAIAGHRGDWRDGRVPERAARLNQPILAFQASVHPGARGRAVSMLSLDDTTGQIAVAAMKQAEDSDEIVLRFQETYGRAGRTHVTLGGRVVSAREINAAEEPVGPLTTTGDGVTLEFTPYRPRTIAIRLAPAPAPAPSRSAAALELPFNLDGVSTDGDWQDGDFDGKGHTISGELLPRALALDGVAYTFGSSARGAKNVLVPRGQTLTLPAGSFDRVYVLAAAVGGDVATTIRVGDAERQVTVQEWEGAIGQWDSRLKDLSAMREPFVPSSPRGVPSVEGEVRNSMAVQWDPQTFAVTNLDQLRPGFVKRDEVAWIGTHRHARDGNQVYIMSYIFAYVLELPAGARAIVLPTDDRLRIFAITAAREPARVRPGLVWP
ncbi:MAG: alpha-mannosidase [Vicinamibacterales bacterium]